MLSCSRMYLCRIGSSTIPSFTIHRNELSAKSLPTAGELGADLVEVVLDDVQADRQFRIGEVGIGFIRALPARSPCSRALAIPGRPARNPRGRERRAAGPPGPNSAKRFAARTATASAGGRGGLADFWGTLSTTESRAELVSALVVHDQVGPERHDFGAHDGRAVGRHDALASGVQDLEMDRQALRRRPAVQPVADQLGIGERQVRGAHGGRRADEHDAHRLVAARVLDGRARASPSGWSPVRWAAWRWAGSGRAARPAPSGGS